MDTRGLMDRNEWKMIIHMIDLVWFSLGSCSLPKVLGIKTIVVVVHMFLECPTRNKLYTSHYKKNYHDLFKIKLRLSFKSSLNPLGLWSCSLFAISIFPNHLIDIFMIRGSFVCVYGVDLESIRKCPKPHNGILKSTIWTVCYDLYILNDWVYTFIYFPYFLPCTK